MSFTPSVHGWAFPDRFDVAGPALGLGARPARMALGGGMCRAALDRYLEGRALPAETSPPEPGSPLHTELHRRQITALEGVWPRVRAWQALPDGSWRDRFPFRMTPGRRDVASLTRRGWPALRRALEARPVLLTLVEAEDGYARGAAARQVLAFGWTREKTRVVLSIYDPARPGHDDIRLAFSLGGPLDARLTGGQPVRGFFATDHDRVAAAPLKAETFADRSVVGLNRKVRGRPGAAAGLRWLHVVGRDGEGALIHFRRRPKAAWEGANITEREDLSGCELHSDPVPLAGPFGLGLDVFARSYVGDLLHFRLLRRWRVANRTEHRRAGPRFRLEGPPVPVPLPWGGACVVGRGKEGALVAYSRVPFRGWRAEEVPGAGGAAMAGDPRAVRIGPVVHVVARSPEGNALHFERTQAGWSAGDLMTLCAGSRPVVDVPAPHAHQGRLHLLGRTPEDELLHMERGEDGQWAGAVVAGGIAGPPAVTEGPGGLHVFATTTAGGLLHAWWAGSRWRTEDLLATRPGADPATVPDQGLAAWGSDDELRVFGRRKGAGLVQWVWREDADWSASRLAERAGAQSDHEPGDDPVLIRGGGDAFHLFATDGRDTVVHFERGPWRETTTRVAAASSTGAPAGVRPARPVPKAALEALADGRVKATPAAAPDASGAVQETPPAATEPEPAGLTPVPTEEAEPLPLLEDAAEGPAEELPVFEPMDLDELSWPPKPGKRAKPTKPAADPPWPELG